MVDSIYRMRSLGVAAAGIPDQYADGRAAKVWELYIGSKRNRTSQYKDWLREMLASHNCQTLLDVACGTGVDSSLLVDMGFTVTSTDASDKMLKYALQERWSKRKDEKYDKWVIQEANWLTLVDDLGDQKPGNIGWDAVICLGNSFAHLPDFSGDLQNQKLALANMHDLLRPGGVLIIDHRNYDAILDYGRAPSKNIYYNSDHIVDIKTSNLYVNGNASMVTLDYKLDITGVVPDGQVIENEAARYQTFRLSYYPHRLKSFSTLLENTFGRQSTHTVYGDFLPYNAETTPSYYVHFIVKDL